MPSMDCTHNYGDSHYGTTGAFVNTPESTGRDNGMFVLAVQLKLDVQKGLVNYLAELQMPCTMSLTLKVI